VEALEKEALFLFFKHSVKGEEHSSENIYPSCEKVRQLQ
jgi:hypothetical protein